MCIRDGAEQVGEHLVGHLLATAQRGLAADFDRGHRLAVLAADRRGDGEHVGAEPSFDERPPLGADLIQLGAQGALVDHRPRCVGLPLAGGEVLGELGLGEVGQEDKTGRHRVRGNPVTDRQPTVGRAPGPGPGHIDYVAAVAYRRRGVLGEPRGQRGEPWLERLGERQARQVGVAEFERAREQEELAVVPPDIAQRLQGHQQPAGDRLAEVTPLGDLGERQRTPLVGEDTDHGQPAFEALHMLRGAL